MPDLFDIIHREWPVIKSAPYSFFIAVACIFAIVWFAFERRYRKRLEALEGGRAEAAGASVSHSGNATMSGSGNSSVNITLPGAAQPPAVSLKRPPRVDCVSIIPARISESEVLRLGIIEYGEPNAVIAMIANDAARGAGAARGVSAQIVFRSDKGEVARGFGTWLDSYSHYAYFGPGRSHQLVLVRKVAGVAGVHAVLNPRGDYEPTFVTERARLRWMMGGHTPLQCVSLVDRKLQVGISIFDEDGDLLCNLDLAYEHLPDGQLSFTRL